MTKLIRSLLDFTTRISIPNLIRIFLFLFLLLSVPLTIISIKETRDIRSLASCSTSISFDLTPNTVTVTPGASTTFTASLAFYLPPARGYPAEGRPSNSWFTIEPIGGGITVASNPTLAAVSDSSGWFRGTSQITIQTSASTPNGTYSVKATTAASVDDVTNPTICAVSDTSTITVNQPPPPCTNACSAGAKQCANNTSYQTCGDYNGDGCLEWSSAKSCSAGQTCSGSGVCKASGGGGGGGGGTKTGTLDSLQLGISVPYLVGSLKTKVDVGGVSKDVEITPANKNYTLDLKGSNLSLSKEYTLVVTSGKTLVRKTKVTPTTSSTTVQVADLILGDINQDNSIDTTDQISLVDSIASQTSTGDLNADTATNSMDWAILLTNFGKKGD